MMNKKVMILFVVMFLMMVIVVASQPVQLTDNPESLTIGYPKYTYVQTNQNFSLHFHVVNTTDYVTPAKASCYVHLYANDGSHSGENQAGADSNGFDFELNVLSGNFSTVGVHGYAIFCNSSSQVGMASGDFIATPNGTTPNTPNAILYTMGLLFLLIIIGLFMFAISITEYLPFKVGAFLFAYVFGILFMFSAWQLFDGYLIGFIGLQVMFKWLFYIMVFGLLPVLMASFVFIVYMIIMHDEMKNMMDKGLSPEEAYKRAWSKRLW